VLDVERADLAALNQAMELRVLSIRMLHRKKMMGKASVAGAFCACENDAMLCAMRVVKDEDISQAQKLVDDPVSGPRQFKGTEGITPSVETREFPKALITHRPVAGLLPGRATTEATWIHPTMFGSLRHPHRFSFPAELNFHTTTLPTSPV
jgi:hypothetical protein